MAQYFGLEFYELELLYGLIVWTGLVIYSIHRDHKLKKIELEKKV